MIVIYFFYSYALIIFNKKTLAIHEIYKQQSNQFQIDKIQVLLSILFSNAVLFVRTDEKKIVNFHLIPTLKH